MTVSTPPVSAEPVKPYSTRVRASRPWTSIDSSAALPAALSVSRPGAALDAVDAVRRAAREAVVAVAQVDRVVALAAGDDVAVGPAEQRVGGVGAVEHVLAGAAVERERDAATVLGV